MTYYDLLPYIVRLRDHLAAAGLGQGAIKRWTDCMDAVQANMATEIEGLATLSDPAVAQMDCLVLMAATLGCPVELRGDETFQRWLVSSITALHKIKGRSEERRVGKECRSRWGPEH